MAFPPNILLVTLMGFLRDFRLVYPCIGKGLLLQPVHILWVIHMAQSQELAQRNSLKPQVFSLAMCPSCPCSL